MERLEAKRVKGHTYYYYSKWAASTTAADACGRGIWASWKTSSRPSRGVDRLPSPQRSSSGDCPKPSGRKPPEHNSPISSTAAAPNAGKVDHRSVPGDRRDQPGDQPT